MKKLIALTAVFVIAFPALADEEGFTPIFDGKSLKGWKAVFRPADKDADPAKTWEVKDGVIESHGSPFGYLHTEENFSNYVIRYDWSFPKKQPPKTTLNTGLLVHIQPPHEVFPKCVEPQGRLMDHGKLFFIKLKPIGEAVFDQEAHKKASKPQGEWNTTEVTCAADGTVTVKLNGVEVAKGKTELTSGQIGFQSEGAEFHFKNVRVKKNK